jgi:DnaK suppressor protein
MELNKAELVAEQTRRCGSNLRNRAEAIDRALQRVADSTCGRSVRSGAVIPDARLEADPVAELTVDEAPADEAARR